VDGLAIPQEAQSFCDVVSLKQPDRGDSGRACLQACSRVFRRNSTESQDWERGVTGLELRDRDWKAIKDSSASCARFFEDWSKDREISPVGRSTGNFLGGMTRDGDGWVSG